MCCSCCFQGLHPIRLPAAQTDPGATALTGAEPRRARRPPGSAVQIPTLQFFITTCRSSISLTKENGTVSPNGTKGSVTASHTSRHRPDGGTARARPRLVATRLRQPQDHSQDTPATSMSRGRVDGSDGAARCRACSPGPALPLSTPPCVPAPLRQGPASPVQRSLSSQHRDLRSLSLPQSGSQNLQTSEHANHSQQTTQRCHFLLHLSTLHHYCEAEARKPWHCRPGIPSKLHCPQWY